MFGLSGDTVTLDYDGLINVATLAVRYSLVALERATAKWHEVGNAPTSVEANWMLETARHLADATTVLHVLTEGNDRPYVEVTGKETRPRNYNKIILIKILRDMMAVRGYVGIMSGERLNLPHLRDCKELVEALIEAYQEY